MFAVDENKNKHLQRYMSETLSATSVDPALIQARSHLKEECFPVLDLIGLQGRSVLNPRKG